MAFGVQFEHQRWREDAKPKPGGTPPTQSNSTVTEDVLVVRGFWRDPNDVLWTHVVERRFPTADAENGLVVVGRLVAELQAEVVTLILETQQQLQGVSNAAR